MIHCIVALALTMVMASPQAAGDRTAASVQAVRAAEAARIAALVANDFAALDRILGDDLTYTHSNAQTDGKAQFIGNLKAGTSKYEALEPIDPQVRVYGTTAVMTGRVNVRLLTNGQPVPPFALTFTSVWVQRDGRWQFVAWQSTRLPSN